MTLVHVLTLADEDGTLVGVYSTDALAKQALIDFIADSQVNPAGTETYLGDECPDDWMYEPTAFELATHVMGTQMEHKWEITACTVDEEI
jgi:hypothetical protein